jgi:hypothetical protein
MTFSRETERLAFRFGKMIAFQATELLAALARDPITSPLPFRLVFARERPLAVGVVAVLRATYYISHLSRRLTRHMYSRRAVMSSRPAPARWEQWARDLGSVMLSDNPN